jgi:hypothetical protein
MNGYGSSGEEWKIIIGIIIGLIILFLICRELICWYYKLNRIVALLEEQNNLLKRQNRTAALSQEQNRPLSDIWNGNVTTSNRISSTSGQKKCARCGNMVDSDYSGCPYCGNKELI